jgi:MFS family permease
MRRREEPAPRPGLLMRDVREGLVFVFHDRVLRAVAGSLSALYLFITAPAPLIILFFARELRLAPAAIGIAYAVGGAGTLIGAIANAPLVRRLGLNRVMALSVVVAALGPLCVAAATRSTAFPMLLLGELLTAVGGTVFAVVQVSLRQKMTPPELQGRMNGTMRFMGIGGRAVGVLLAGIVADLIGLRTTIGLAALGGVVALAWIAASPIVRMKSLADATEPQVGTGSCAGPADVRSARADAREERHEART